MAKNFVLQLGSLAALFVSLPAFVALLFGIINLQFPDAADQYWQVENFENSVRYSIAVVVIFFPLYLILTRIVNEARRDEGKLYHTLTKWLIYLALLVAGIVMATDLAVVVYTFLNGEITMRFILKALALLLIVGAAFYYYVLDAKEYWSKRERTSLMIGGAALAVVAAAVVVGYLKIDAPSVVREIRLDEEQLNDLREMQWRIEEFHQVNGAFPGSLEEVFAGLPVPVAPEGRAAYDFNVTGADTYELCATFAAATPESERNMAKPVVADSTFYYQNQNWEHGAGRKCFERRIIENPALTR